MLLPWCMSQEAEKAANLQRADSQAILKVLLKWIAKNFAVLATWDDSLLSPT